ncbi:porin [Duganella aceris]|uniref:Porin n=1 Tax=Duganella aceris TaxID=2703883 RepID=A0ABX0FVM9_9BURK|nr:porin [Duganella aceris]NGZ88513.1 porin [Duganella aceris]
MNSIFFRAAACLLTLSMCDNAAAQSDATIYGVMDAAVLRANDTSGNSCTYMRSGNQLASRIGFKGVEELGGGTQVLYVLEAGVNLDTGAAPQSGSIFNRQSYIALSDRRLGTLVVGRQYPTYYQFVGLLVRAGAPTGSTDAHPGDIDGLDAASRFSNSVGYTTPEWRGVQFGFVAGSGEQGRDQANGDAFSAAARYHTGPWNFALGYQLLTNGPDRISWDPSVSGSLSRSALNDGYLSAETVRSIAAASRLSAGKLSLSGAVSNVQYKPDTASRFTDIASFNTVGATVTWQTSTAWLLGASVSCTRENIANGIKVPANYRQLSLEQIYVLSRRANFYLAQARQIARGSTLGANGQPVAAVAVVGDSQLATPSSTGRQNVFMAGLRYNF